VEADRLQLGALWARLIGKHLLSLHQKGVKRDRP
jgi:hypothetical protein